MSEKYCVMNMKKNKRADVKGLQEEANRELEEYKNEVKKELTHTNYFFVKMDLMKMTKVWCLLRLFILHHLNGLREKVGMKF